MNTVFLSVLVGFFGLLATLAAFGGDTWKDGSQSFLNRLTLRGWVSLTSLLLAFAIGSYKDVRQNREESEYSNLLASKEDLEVILESQKEHLLQSKNDLEATEIELASAIARLERRKVRIKERFDEDDGRFEIYSFGEMPINVASIDEYSIITLRVDENSPQWVGLKQYKFAAIGYPYHSSISHPITSPNGRPIYDISIHKYQEILRAIVTEVETDADGDIEVIEATHELCISASLRDEEGGSHVKTKYFKIRPLPKSGTISNSTTHISDGNCNIGEFKNRVNDLKTMGRIYRPIRPENNGCGFQWRVSCAVMVDFAFGIGRWKEIYSERN